MLRLQGFPDSFKINIPLLTSKKGCWKFCFCSVITSIAFEMIKSLENKKPARNEIQLNLLETQCMSIEEAKRFGLIV